VIIETPYNFGDVVFIKTDEEQKERMITEICVKSPSLLVFQLTHGVTCSWHYEYEFETEINVATKIKNS
jgi:hypothetical protein